MPPMPDHADSLDDALTSASTAPAGRPGTHRAPRRHHRRGGRGRLGDRIITRPLYRHGHARRGLPHRRRGTKLDRVTAMADRLERRAGTEAMTEFTASTYATPRTCPPRSGRANGSARRARTCGAASGPVLRRILQGSGTGHRTHRRTERMDHGLEPQPGTRPRPRLAGGGGTSRDSMRASPSNDPTPARKRGTRRHGTNRTAPARCGTHCAGHGATATRRRLRADPRRPGHARHGPRPLRPQDRPTDRLDIADKTAILSNLFESWRADDANGRPVWTDTTIGAMARTLMPGTDEPTRLAERLATDMSLSEWIWGIARELPDGLRQAREHNAYGVPPRAIDARPDDYREFRARREEQLGQWRKQPERAEAAHADQADAERLEHVAGLLERVQPTPLEAEQIKAPLGAPWIPARDVHDFMMETFNVHGHGLTPGKLAHTRSTGSPARTMARRLLGRRRHRLQGRRTYGTEDRNPFQLLEACLNNAQITVTKDSPRRPRRPANPNVRTRRPRWPPSRRQRDPRRVEPMGVQDPPRAGLTALYNRRFNGMRPATSTDPT
ncbi:MAG: hypothetical protein ACLS6O_00160 [Bifidobacterium sp.]